MEKLPDISRNSFINQRIGIVSAVVIWALWLLLLTFNLRVDIKFNHPAFYLSVLLQTHLFTGLFITAHDAMHGTVSHLKWLNQMVGKICLWSFAGNRWSILYPKHHQHHQFVATQKDPDYSEKGFWRWYLKFLKEYVSWQQIVVMAILFNVAKIWINPQNLILFYVVPSILSTLQLFYFGTFLPHKGTHDQENVHKARSQAKNHVWAFLSCYFFGYHYEHHNKPNVPWWQLPLEKSKAEKKHNK